MGKAIETVMVIGALAFESMDVFYEDDFMSHNATDAESNERTECKRTDRHTQVTAVDRMRPTKISSKTEITPSQQRVIGIVSA